MKPKEVISHLADPTASYDLHMMGFNRCLPDWRVGPRCLDAHLLYVVEDGWATGVVDGQTFELSGGAALWLPPGVCHQMEIPAGRRPLRVHHMRLRCAWSHDHPIFVSDGDRLVQQADLLTHAVAPEGALARTRQRCALIGLLAAIVQANTLKKQQFPVLTHEQRQQVVSYLQSCPADSRPSSQDLADVVGMTLTWFSRRFRQTYGRSPRGWLKQQRLQRAAAYLAESQESVTAVAELFGYTEVYQFSRQFREELGCSPREWCKRYSG